MRCFRSVRPWQNFDFAMAIDLSLDTFVRVVRWSSKILSQWLHIESLSKTTKLILLDSLLQEVCINSWRRWVAHLRVRSGWVSILVSHKPSFFRTKESPLKNNNLILVLNWNLLKWCIIYWQILSCLLYKTKVLHLFHWPFIIRLKSPS